MEQKSMACTGSERSLKKHHVVKKSLKIEKFWDIVEKSLNFPQRSLKTLCKGKIESTAVRKFSW